MSEPWRTLKVGDRIRIVKMPSGINASGYCFPAMTRQLYKLLIARKRPVRVYEIFDRVPWISCRFRLKDGRWDYHILAVNDDSWVLVRRRESK